MANNLFNSLTLNFKQILIDEIALNGLAGISFDLLWLHVERRISTPITDKMKERYWSFLCKCDCVSFYQVPERPTPCTELLDRFTIIDDYLGELMDPTVYLDGDYEYRPIENQGSCSNFRTRKELSKEKLSQQAFEVVWAEYGTSLVMVASLQERWRALAPHVPASIMMSLTPLHYCILELIGKSRENGQMTNGKTNITKIIKEPKFLFYNRKHLQDLNLIKIVCLTVKHVERGMKSLLIRLNRFHKPCFLSMPKVGPIYKLRQYLLEQPNFCAKTSEVTSRGLVTPKSSKRLQKTINIFKFEERMMQPELSKKKRALIVKSKFISLQSISDESSQSEDEDSAPLQCQYRVGVDLLRQAYERFLEAGLKGLTQNELAQLIGIEFYTSRTICRLFKRQHIVKEHLEDKGKQRTARFFAVAAATGEMEQIYEEQRQKLLEYVKVSKSRKRRGTLAENIQDEDRIPLKKIKLETKVEESAHQDKVEVLEIKVLDGLEEFSGESMVCAKKKPTLRQLKYANGLLKLINEKLAISGYQNLTSLIASETGEPPMDTKALKIFVQKLVTDGLLKLIKLKWPGFQQQSSILICAPYVKCTDPIIKEKQKEVSIRAMTKRKVKKANIEDIVHKPPLQHAYPRYMKIKLLHEFLMKLVYFEEKMTIHNLPMGFSSLVNIIPEITVEFAIGNVSQLALTEIIHLNIDDNVLPLKLRDAPEEIYRSLLQSKSLQSSIRINLKVLAMLGLIQLVRVTEPQTTENCFFLSSFIFYVNRQAKILDTTGTWPREDDAVEEKTFYFESFADVKNYWNEVYIISTNTTIEHGNRQRKRLTPPVRPLRDVEAHDCGLRFGNGAGPCGFDACFFMEQPRFWKTFYSRIIKNKTMIKKQPVKKKPVVAAEKKPKKIPKKEPKKKTKPKPVALGNQTNPRHIIRRKRLTTSAIRWSKFEDTVLMMCKVAITIMSPVSQPGCLKIRNDTAKTLLSIFDSNKHSSACHRRASHLELDLSLEHEKECLINELRRKRHLIVKYEGLLKKIRLRNITNMTKYTNESRIPMLEVVWLVNQLVDIKASSPAVPCVATNFEDFHRKYEVSKATANKPCNSYKAEADLNLLLAKETIVQIIISNYNNTPPAGHAKKLFDILVKFPEARLRVGLDQLRKSGVVACKEKSINNHLHRFHIHSIPLTFRVASAYTRKWINRLNTNFPDALGNLIESELSQTNIKASPEMNCLICELQAVGMLEVISVIDPVISGPSGSILQEQQLNVFDIEMNFKLKSGVVGWKKLVDFNQFTDHFRNINYEDSLPALKRNAVVEVTNEQNEEDLIVSHLKEHGERGMLFSDLIDRFGNNPSIMQKLADLESKNIIKRVGFYENRLIHTQFAEAWTTTVDDKFIIPTPWLTFNCEIRKDIFLKWSAVIMNKLFEHPGCTAAYMSDTVELLTTRAVQDILMFLEKCQCVELKVLRAPEIDLFSEDVPPVFCEFNPYEAPENIHAFPLKDALTKFSYMKRKFILNKN